MSQFYFETEYICKFCDLDGRLFATHSFTNCSSKDGKKPKYRLAQTQFDLIFTLSDFVSPQKRTFFLSFFCFSPDCTFSSSRVMLKRPKKSLIVHTANIFLEGYTIWLLHILIQAEQKRS